MNEEELTKEDILNVTGSMFATMLDYVENSDKEINKYKKILTELENYLMEKFEAIRTLKEILGDDVKILNPDIKGIEMGYKDIQDKIQELKEKYK